MTRDKLHKQLAHQSSTPFVAHKTHPQKSTNQHFQWLPTTCQSNWLVSRGYGDRTKMQTGSMKQNLSQLWQWGKEILDKDHITETKEGILPSEVAHLITTIIDPEVTIIQEAYWENRKTA